ncbi:CAP domain-containing protein [Streptomyces sp. DG2A-72]|uniref:CAP domain-containing protein n=1 Tax=Streptomyces sp. DG2A-72 TaxID=3051386 RepID=UPI00265C1C47|nr:CAP domain-containing protein [Streptomyces sp. DG2A-72]MDO0936900.1 CAP domain-containing protein [Streptomyces sp. DG2A-72]
MGRHRRSAAGRAATGRATGVTETYGSRTGSHDPQDSYDAYAADRSTTGMAPYLSTEAYAETTARSERYLFASDEDYRVVFPEAAPGGGGRRAAGHRRKKKAARPVRAGLLGVSAAVAIGTVAVATGVVPGVENYKLGGGSDGADNVQAVDTPSNSATEQGGTSGAADSRETDESASRGDERSASPTPSASASSEAPAKTPSKEPKAPPAKTKKPKPTPTPSRPATKAPEKDTSAPVTVSAEARAEAEVLKLVNQERAKVGCSPVSANSALAELARDFSDAMAALGFFDHTDPNGATPWDRAEAAGIADLGGENIARGQADAAAVMEAWMNSPGHKANILNCDFKTLGVGVHLGPGGPWWTQDFGY